jgi:hypothetical protein
MKKYIKTFSIFLILSIVLSVQVSFGGKLESFLGAGEYLNASCGNNDQNSNDTIVELNANERIQINCGILDSEEDIKNINLQNGDTVKIICVPPEEYGDVVIPMTLNDVQQVLCTSQDIE